MNKLQHALNLLNASQFEKARPMLEELLSEKPDDTDVLYNLGMCYTEIGKPDLAIKTLSRLVDLQKDHSNVHVAMGYAYARLRNNSRAIECFLNALELDENNPYALRNLGALYGKEGEFTKGIDCLRKSFSLNPNDANTAYGLGFMYFNIADFTNAGSYLKKTIQLDDNSPIAEAARDLLREIAVFNVKSKGFRIDAMFYCIGALQRFQNMSIAEIKQISFEIAVEGRQGLDINNPDKKYTLNSMKGEFTGLQLVSYMYVGLKKIAPEQDTGIDLSEEYRMALRFIELKRAYGHSFN
ncbi:MAG: tetratricopeptide repeat protein [Syntrophales bacterium LBB04]|nr:tetratricopeptide repeat protein [Syntrophales bacterium LBB04]